MQGCFYLICLFMIVSSINMIGLVSGVFSKGLFICLSNFIWVLPFVPFIRDKINKQKFLYTVLGFIVQGFLVAIAIDGSSTASICIYTLVGLGIFTYYKSAKSNNDNKMSIYRKTMIDILKCHYIIQRLRNYVISLNIPLINSLKSEFIINELKTSDGDFKNFYNAHADNYLARECENNNKIILDSLYNTSPVEIKNNLYNKYNIDISIIDDVVNNLEKEFDESIELGLQRKNYIPNRRPSDIQQVMKRVTNEVNKVYLNKLDDMLNILNFGIYNFVSCDIESFEKRRNSLKYYNVSSYDTICTNEVEYYFAQILLNSIYPSFVSKHFELEYMNESQILVINYNLPNVDDLPQMQELKYFSTNRELKNIPYKEKELEAIYENVVYQLVLRTIYEIFVADRINAVTSVVFNGILNFIDKSDGKEKSAFTVSIHANKEEFLDINLDKVDPRQCFKKLRGISGASLYNIVPIRPILNLNKEDKRFIEAEGVIDEIDEGYNLATMDWKEFEYLVREIFEKEFSKNGGEVKVTQSSRDGGVDAIAFDPDPIRGGKIVIQAKRYTNVVGVSAVRDLYGTVMNEGATKGILVTTSDFGKDSFDFAKDKPLTLLNGANLLSLLESHGYKARIDVKEAKKILQDEK